MLVEAACCRHLCRKVEVANDVAISSPGAMTSSIDFRPLLICGLPALHLLHLAPLHLLSLNMPPDPQLGILARLALDHRVCGIKDRAVEDGQGVLQILRGRACRLG